MTLAKYGYLPILLLMLFVFTGTGISADTSEETGGAAAFHGLADHANSPWYSPFNFSGLQSDENLTVIPIQPYNQSTESTCGSAVAIMVLRYFGQDGDEIQISREMRTVPIYGTNVNQMTDWFKKRNWKVRSNLDYPKGNLTLLRDNLKQGIPTMVAWSDWGGHWQVVAGYDTMGTESVVDDVIIFADPYDVTDHQQDGYYRYPACRFDSMWYVPHWFPEESATRAWVTAVPPGNE